MRLDFRTLLVVATGAFFYWMLSGFKGTFNSYMSRYYEGDSKYYKNFWTGLAILIFIVINLVVIIF